MKKPTIPEEKCQSILQKDDIVFHPGFTNFV